ncbi:MAG TPA: sigma-70 family RNA polymerase sigma factor [Acidimicrobiales bacterium]
MGSERSSGDQDLVRTYLDGIGRYRLLTKDDEIRLARRIEQGREAETELVSADVLPGARVRELRRIRRDGQAATEEFIKSNLRLVVSVAKKYQSAEMPLLDLIQEGNLGLMHAVDKFDWRKGFKFSTYATWWIRQAIGRGIDNSARTVRLPVHAGDQIRRVLRAKAQFEGETGRTPTSFQLAEQLQMPEAEVASLLRHVLEPVSLATPVGSDGDTELGDVVADATAPSPFDLVAGQLLGAEIDKLLSRLGERERQILRLRYGLDRGEPRTLEEVGAALNLTRERIRQIERSALAKLRQPSTITGARDLLAS